MRDQPGILILGGGIAGLSTGYHLAGRSPHSLVLVEREEALARHSSAKSASLLRTCCADPATTALTRESGEVLRDPPAVFGAGSLVQGGGLVLFSGPRGAADLGREVAPSVARGEARPMTVEELDAGLPGFRSPYGRETAAWHFPGDGWIDTERLLDGLARGARAGGVEFKTATPVAALEREGDAIVGVRLTDGGVLRARTVVLAAGAWAGALGTKAGSRVILQATRRHLLVHLPRDPGAAPPARGPALWDVEAGFYLRPERGGLLLCCCDQSDVEDPDALAADPATIDRVRETAARYLERPPAAREESWAGLRTMTADDAFALGPDPDLSGLFWVAGLGGAGMGAGVAVGRLAADLLAGGEDPLQDPLDPARLSAILR